MDEKIAIPNKIGPYQLKATIGFGAFSVVKIAYRLDTGDSFACKIIPQRRLVNQSMFDTCEKEIRVLQQLNNRYVVQLIDILKDTLNYYILMDLCVNGNLNSYIVKNKKLSEIDAKNIFRQILEGVGYIHSMKLAHRDLKLENILLDQGYTVKIADFGFSRFFKSDSLATTACGSPFYASPELLSGCPYDPFKSDMWSLGVILYALVSGNIPWTEKNKQRLYDQIKRGEYFNPMNISNECISFIRNLICIDINQRLDINSALNHSWMRNESFIPIPVFKTTYISLRTIDKFFEIDKEDLFIDEMKIIPKCPSHRDIKANTNSTIPYRQPVGNPRAFCSSSNQKKRDIIQIIEESHSITALLRRDRRKRSAPIVRPVQESTRLNIVPQFAIRY